MITQNDILSIFPTEKSQKIETYQEILSILSTISERTIDSTYSLLDSLNIFDTDTYLSFIIRKIITFCEIFPFHIDSYINLALKISLKMPKFKESFLSNSFHRYYYFIDCCEGTFILYMLYNCIKVKLLTFDEVLSRFKELCRKKKHYGENNILFFVYFSPEIKESDTTFYDELTKYCEYVSKIPLISSRELFQYYLNVYQKVLIENDFEILRQYRNDGHLSENPLFEIIYNDDIDKLREFLSNPNKSGNEVIRHSIISPYREIANNLSLISTAAVFSAVKCFKYLLLNGSKTDEVSTETGSLAQDTIVGGNIEIIRFAQQNRVDYDGALTTCANYFRNEIFEWIFEMRGNDPKELTKQSPTGSTVICQACRVGNIEIVLKCIELGIDLNSKDINSTPISEASLGGCDEIVDILLSFGSLKNLATKPQNDIQKVEKTETKNNDKDDKYEEENDSDDYEQHEYEYDYDNFDFDDNFFNAFYRIKKSLNIEQKINMNSIYHAMREAASEGQRNCVEEFINRGFIVDIPMIVRAIIYSRFSTLKYLLEKVEFNYLNDQNDRKNHLIEMTIHSIHHEEKQDNKNIENEQEKKDQIISNTSTNEASNNTVKIDLMATTINNDANSSDISANADISESFLVKKDFKFIYEKMFLFIYIIKFLMKQNDVDVVKLVFDKLKFDIDEENKEDGLLHEIAYNAYNFVAFEMPDTVGFLFHILSDSNRIELLKQIPENHLIELFETSIYKGEMINFCAEYKKKNEGKELPPKIQKIFEIIKFIV